MRQHLAWDGETSGKEEVGRLAGQHPRGCLGGGEEEGLHRQDAGGASRDALVLD